MSPQDLAEETRVSRVWAVVPTYDRPELALQTIGRLREQTLALAGIILVDDGSPARIGELARLRFGNRVAVLRLEQNAGPAAGFAAGMRMAMERGADWTWLLDDDSWPHPTALEELVSSPAFFAPDTVALCSLKEDPDGGLQKWEARMDGRRLRQPEETDYQRPVFEVDVAPFAGLLVRAAALPRAGLPDARYFSWFADYEFCLRLRREGRIFCVAASRLVHENDGWRDMRLARGRCRPSLTLFLKLCTGLRNRAFYFSRNHGWLPTLPQVAVRFARMTGGILLWDDHKLFRMRALARAFLDGLRGRLGPFPIS